MLIFFGIEIDYIYNVINFVTKSAILSALWCISNRLERSDGKSSSRGGGFRRRVTLWNIFIFCTALIE